MRSQLLPSFLLANCVCTCQHALAASLACMDRFCCLPAPACPLSATAIPFPPLSGLQAIQYANDDISKVGQVATELACDAIAKVYGVEALTAQDLGGPLSTSCEVCPATGCA